MTAYYVRSGAAGAGTGADWTNAYTTLAAAIASKAAGDIFYISEDHSESTAGTVTISPPGTNASPNFFYCVNHLGSVPPVAADLRTTGQIATTGNNNLTISNSCYVYGLILVCGNSSGSPILELGATGNDALVLENCTLKFGGTAGSNISIGAATSECKVTLDNTTCQFVVASQSILVNGELVWRNTASALGGATFPTTLFTFSATRAGKLTCQGVDLSALGSGKTIISLANATAVEARFMDCKLNASVTLSSTPPSPVAGSVDFIRCGSSGINYDFQKYEYAGTLTTETTIVRSGGASDGATPISWKIVTTANPLWSMPFDSPPIAIWNPVSGSSVTATIEGIWGGGAVPNNDDIWIEAVYLGSGASPLGSFVSDTKANNLAANAALASSAASWGGSTTAFKMAVTFTPNQTGIVLLYVRAAKPSTTFYVDPKVALS